MCISTSSHRVVRVVVDGRTIEPMLLSGLFTMPFANAIPMAFMGCSTMRRGVDAVLKGSR